ncbi:MAG: hypothetical protein NVSMB70_01020 [Chamaesiphon sp.]
MKKHNQFAPKEFSDVPVVTGHHELDATIQRNKNRDMRSKLGLVDFIPNSKVGQNVYGPKTNYGSHGDE